MKSVEIELDWTPQDEPGWEGGGGGGGGGDRVDLGLRSGRKWHAFGIKGFDVSEDDLDPWQVQ